MPEGDTIFRAARTLDRALAGRAVTRFESVFSRLTRANDDRRIVGRTVERVDARGKHLLIWFSGDLVLRTHMRMRGSWHIYRPGERWQRPHADMRIVIGTAEYEAVAFS
ncbi:MAG TPA: DNA-formamidopyrimidine glycosylase family protein, partial [Vicinamibacterales bacterium]